jgi:DNA-binding NarL/FixJ family response regulator
MLKSICPSLKVLLSSGDSFDRRASEIMQRGCAGLIRKPSNLQQISQKIRDIPDQ